MKKKQMIFSRFFKKEQQKKLDGFRNIVREEKAMEAAYEMLLPAPGERPCKRV